MLCARFCPSLRPSPPARLLPSCSVPAMAGRARLAHSRCGQGWLAVLDPSWVRFPLGPLVSGSGRLLQLTETPENKPVEPTEIVEPEPGVEFVVEPEDNQGEPEIVFGHFYPADFGAGEE
ncbi:hypothetical protein C2845_PM08G19340 [Panicum miliaceum]|uniref:Uncharacterized protein n=1 Tax=Panicum miliaceum TaxID=4540 RepID=A0A3L6QXF8_PANMI|nr:hypothetical protein C2845_PM08G19340 [Panicum miliaceum]